MWKRIKNWFLCRMVKTIHVNLYEDYNGYDDLLTIVTEYKSGHFKIKEYLGECTVWHELPSCKRCSTSTELQLSDMWIKEKHLHRMKNKRRTR